MIKPEIINIYTVKFVGLGWLLEVIDKIIKILEKKKFIKLELSYLMTLMKAT